MSPPWKLANATYAEIKSAKYEVAVIPLGATEPHNLHLPYATDTLEAEQIGDHICRAAADKGAPVILLPALPFGTETNQRQFPFALNLNPSTILLVVKDLVESLEASGIRKVVLLNSHGGNELKPILRELYGRTQVHLFLCFWPQVIQDCYQELFAARDDHAGEMETSFAMAYFPELVRRHPDGSLTADAGTTRPFRFQALKEGWVSITRPWHLLTTNTGSGDPRAATAEKGQRMMQILVDRLSQFLLELSQATLDDSFPFADLD